MSPENREKNDEQNLAIEKIQEGIVIDHIKAGSGMALYKHLELDKLDCSVAIIKNARSQRMGKKDIIKINKILDIDWDVIGFIDCNVTVNLIHDGKSEKKNITLPQEVRNVIVCKNPRCITSIEQGIEQVFKLADPVHHIYRCIYCEQKYEPKYQKK